MNITREQVDTLCAALPGAVLAHPPELVSWKVGGKMFACFGGDGDMNGVSVKSDSIERAEMLIQAGIAVPAPYFHKSWIRFEFADADPAEMTHHLLHSYDLVRRSLKKAVRDALPPRKDA